MAKSSYVGKAGQLVVMAEYLLRGYNVATPEVDEGDDVFVVENRSGELWRVQVKTAIGHRRRSGWRTKYSVSLNQIQIEKEPNLFFVFVLRRESIWEFVVINREALAAELARYQVGSRSGGNVLFTVTFQEHSVLCGGRNWQSWRNDWSEWPVLNES